MSYHIVYDWHKTFVFKKKKTISGNEVPRFSFINKRTHAVCEGADSLEFHQYATDKELFIFKLGTDPWEPYK